MQRGPLLKIGNMVPLTKEERKELEEKKFLEYDDQVIIKTDNGYFAGQPVMLLEHEEKIEILHSKLIYSSADNLSFPTRLKNEEIQLLKAILTANEISKIVSIEKKYHFPYDTLMFTMDKTFFPHNFSILINKGDFKTMEYDVVYTPKELGLI